MSARRTCTSSPTASPRRTSTTGWCRTRPGRAAPRAARAEDRPRPSQPAWPRRRSAPTAAGRSGSPQPAAARRLQADLRARADRRVFPLAPSFDHVGPMARDVGGCVSLMRSLAPALSVPELSLGDLRVAVDGETFRSTGPGSRAPWRRPRTRRSSARSATSTGALRRAGGALRREHPHEDRALHRGVGRGVRGCVRCPCGAARAGAGGARRLRRAGTPVFSCPVPAADADEIPVRGAVTLWTFPFNALGWPALAVGGTQIASRPGDDGLVLAAGLALERALKA